MSNHQIAEDNEILRCLVGSRIHGLETTESDHDEMGIFVEPPEYVLGLKGPLDVVVSRTVGEGERSGRDDRDCTWHSLRKYLRLATKGNPNFLLLLYAPPEFDLITSDLAEELRSLTGRVVSRNAVFQTLGYLSGQLKRLERGDGRRVPNRPELIERYGYDTKYAAHAVRLGIQAHELVTHGRLILPMEEWKRLHILDVRNGVPTKADAIEDIVWWRTVTERVLEGRIPLADQPDYAALDRWLIRAHRQFWKDKDYG